MSRGKINIVLLLQDVSKFLTLIGVNDHQTVTAALTFEAISCNWYVCLLLGILVKGWVGGLRGLTD